MSLRAKKYEQVILYFASKLGKEIRGKKKLAKLLYYVDFDFFEKYQRYFIGDKYKKLPMGPYPVSLEKITKKMATQKKLTIKFVDEWNGYNPTEVYKSLVEPDTSVFSKEEKQMLDRVIKKYGHLNGKELENLTHAEAPYIGTEEKGEIPYELAFYRGTDFAHD